MLLLRNAIEAVLVDAFDRERDVVADTQAGAADVVGDEWPEVVRDAR